MGVRRRRTTAAHRRRRRRRATPPGAAARLAEGLSSATAALGTTVSGHRVASSKVRRSSYAWGALSRAAPDQSATPAHLSGASASSVLNVHAARLVGGAERFHSVRGGFRGQASQPHHHAAVVGVAAHQYAAIPRGAALGGVGARRCAVVLGWGRSGLLETSMRCCWRRLGGLDERWGSLNEGWPCGRQFLRLAAATRTASDFVLVGLVGCGWRVLPGPVLPLYFVSFNEGRNHDA